MKKIAITGGIAAGKTSVCNIFEKNGAYVLSADKIVHQLLSPHTAIGKQVVSLLGETIISGQQFDRGKIAQTVFNHPEKLRALENILHPAVFDEINKHYQTTASNPKYTFFVAEIPLLYESEKEHFFDIIITVLADEVICKERFRKSHTKEDEFEKRMARQLPPKHKADKSHYVITNSGSFEDLETQVKQLISTL